ncbi:MAG: hypothetical protein J5819_09750 [Eubacterium sp.]|nr:hypothetical protein [Eubacterium sp.]
MKYTNEIREALLRRMLPPNNESPAKLAKESGISEPTLRDWKKKAMSGGMPLPEVDIRPDDWSTQDKFVVVVETFGLSETELAEYARKKGLYVDQIKSWRDACINANGGMTMEASILNKELKAAAAENRQLHKELDRKEKALAEAAALLVLRKKANAIWGDPEDE